MGFTEKKKSFYISTSIGRDTYRSKKEPSFRMGQYYYGNVNALATLMGVEGVVEVGVAYGGHAHHLMSNLNGVKYVGVDMYKFNYDASDPFCSDVEQTLGIKGQLAMDKLFGGVSDSLRIYGDRASLIRMDSQEFSQQLADSSQQLVFLDGNHTYQYVRKELECWWPKIRMHGVLCGDDYWMESVSSAVNHFVKNLDLTLNFISKNDDYKTWFIQKR